MSEGKRVHLQRYTWAAQLPLAHTLVFTAGPPAEVHLGGTAPPGP